MAKIIFLTEEIIKAGGIVRVVNMWANYFAKRGDNIQIIASDIDNPFYSFDEKIKIFQRDFSFKRKILGIPYNIFQTYRLLKKLQTEDDVNLVVDRAIHIEPIWIFRKLGLFKNLNLIYFAHGGSSDFRDFYMSRLHMRHKVGMMFDAFNKVICLYDDTKNYPKQVKKDKLFFISNPLPFSPSSVTFQKKENIVLSLGRVTKEKGIDTLIKAWSKIQSDTNDWKLQIIGDGRDKKKFLKLAHELNLSNIEFLDSNKNVKSFYEKAKIFVIPSLFEGMPMTILEAMACSCVVISTKTAGGNKLIENNKNGVLVEIENENDLVYALDTLFKNNSKMIELAKNGYNNVQKYKIEDIEKYWEDILI